MKSSFPVKYFLLFLSALLLLVTFVVVSFLLQEFKAHKRILLAKERKNLEILRRIANDNVKSVASDLFYLSAHPLLHRMLENNSPAVQRELADDFKLFSSNSTLYDQIRFLDENGMERIRINFSRKRSIIVSEDKLQNKAERYYFTDAFRLESGRIFVSPFDLNIEQGQIERPLKPMIRFGTPVVDLTGRKRGIVLLNYLGAKLINDLNRAFPESADSFMLLNAQGYWLKGLSTEDEWGFMYNGKKDLTLVKRDPETWEKISGRNEGQFITRQGIVTHTTVHPLGRGMLSSSGSGKAFQASASVLSGKAYHWKLVTVITKEKINKLRTEILLNWLPYLAAVFLFIIVTSIVFALFREHRKRAAMEILQQEKLQGVLEMAGAVCHELNQPLMSILGFAQLLSDDLPDGNLQKANLMEIIGQVERLDRITKKLMHITQYKTKRYLKRDIIDIQAASKKIEQDE